MVKGEDIEMEDAEGVEKDESVPHKKKAKRGEVEKDSDLSEEDLDLKDDLMMVERIGKDSVIQQDPEAVRAASSSKARKFSKRGRAGAGGMDAPEDLLERLRDLLPLHSLAKHASIAKSWKVAYEGRLQAEQQQLRALVAAPAGLPCCRFTDLQQALVELKQLLPVFVPLAGVVESSGSGEGTPVVGGYWRPASSAPGPPPTDVQPQSISGVFDFPRQRSSSSGLQFEVYWCEWSHRRIDFQVRVSVKDVESLRGLMGLLLELSPHLLPPCCNSHLNRPGAVPHATSVVVCWLPFKTGWSMWAPLAPLMGELRFSPSQRGRLSRSSVWSPDSDGLGYIPSNTRYISLWRATCPSARPLTKIYVMAPSWEHSKRWPTSEWVHPE